ncbi:MAG: hydantoinase/oxoprolinase family protein, partial [Thermomicrobiales bacterium]
CGVGDRTGERRGGRGERARGGFGGGVADAIAAGGINARGIVSLVHGTTVVINAITQRRGVRTALVTTAGFRDALQIGRGNRPDMYNLRFHKPRPFVPRRHRFEVRERVAANGEITAPLDEAELEAVALACEREAIEAVAICFLHSYACPDHERQAAAFLRARLPDVAVTASHELTQEWREYERSSTAVLNAYVQPILDRYLTNLDVRLDGLGAGGRRFVMLSNGGTATFASARSQPIQLVESGPAAGIIGAALIGERIGEANVISLDIGGTTAKCSLIENGRPKISGDYRLESTPISPGYPVRVPVVDIVEIGAGGGSIARFDEGGAFRVGPDSAGAVPGPACYGKGGVEPTVTDAMLIAGVIDGEAFLGGRLRLDVGLARAAYGPIADRLGVSVDAAAAGVIRLVNEHTVDALKLVSVRRGYDPRDFTLVAFGGGGPMHAAALAAELGVKQMVIPPFPGTFSAWGMLMTRPRVDRSRTRVGRIDELTPMQFEAAFLELEAQSIEALLGQGFDQSLFRRERALDLRYSGQEHTVRVPVSHGSDALETLASAFHDQHRRTYTFALEQTPVEVVNYRSITHVDVAIPVSGNRTFAGSGTDASPPTRRRSVDFDGTRMETTVLSRETLPAGFSFDGPLIVEEPSATTVVFPRQRLSVDDQGNLVIRAVERNMDLAAGR